MKNHDNINMSTIKKDRFEKLFTESRTKLFAIAYNVVRNKETAEDILQQSYVKAWRNFDNYDPSKKFTNWMTSIIKNASIDAVRSKNREASTYSMEYFNNHTGEKDTLDVIDQSVNIEYNYQLKEFISELNVVIGNLPEDLCEVMGYVLDDKSYAEISEAMNLPLNTIRTKVHRAKKMIRKNADLQFLQNFHV